MITNYNSNRTDNKSSLTKLFVITVVVALLMSLASCELEASNNGELDGFWHLEQIDSLENGKTVDCSNQLIFWGAQLRLIEAKDLGVNTYNRLYLRFEQTSDKLIINKVFENHWHEDNPNGEVGGDVPVEAANDDTRHFGINSIPEEFVKERLDNKKMVLKSDKLRLTFRRF